MTKDNSAAVSEALSNLLDLERQALLVGDLKTIGILLEEKSVLVGQLANQNADSGDGLQPVQAKLKRNQELFDQALAGIRNVADRLGILREIRRSMNVYDAQGRREVIAELQERRLEKKA
ncbi:flagellar protein FlgN [Salipiger sp.]|uniref:flagellar protein FlgN n=1 Tax=Salipiger sp. TaxID=2078585 RepID=UPI003A983475